MDFRPGGSGTPFVDLDAAGVSVSLFTNSSGQYSVALQAAETFVVHSG